MTGTDAAARIHEYAWVGHKPGLERTRALLGALGNPEQSLKFIHITGSNGKGSTAAMLSSILSAAGYRVGLFTSPHLYRFNERFQVCGRPIPDDALGRITERVLAAAEQFSEHPTEFELMTAIGFLWFAEMQCDIVVLEVGLGGRLDSTNVIPAPEAAVITNIGLEHTALLGNTISAITKEKSGIIKSGCSAVLYGQGREAGEVVEDVCGSLSVPLTVTDETKLILHRSDRSGQIFTYRGRGPLHLPLLGAYQLYNTLTVLDTVDALRARGWTISEDAIRSGLAAAKWPGRLELVRRSPDFIIDGGHNPQCAQALAASLRALYPEQKLIFIIGVLADKDWKTMVSEILPLAKLVITVRPESTRAEDENELAGWVRTKGVEAIARKTIREAADAALALAWPEDTICAWGSLYSVGELRHCLGLC